jgi:hypothetical protein
MAERNLVRLPGAPDLLLGFTDVGDWAGLGAARDGLLCTT